ncbi:hypothetical protein HB364_25490 [Pseudoflavitalea sp. X16]|uniref:hypothetical protein n=1 Tax=Paraflavitalea devenefica TaxID=2716334 RepID=UPI001421D810|nr:hypothetical protein [Paraflavitalea devenefica]NII28462.1 hypothetical protein [Paraflavitalea devenefica]
MQPGKQSEQAVLKPSKPYEKTLIAKTFDSGFEWAHDTYNAITVAGDGRVYYVLSSEKHDVAGRIYVYAPVGNVISFLGDLTEVCGEQGQNLISQGKSHVEFYERGSRLFFSTHVGYYELIDGMDRLPQHAPKGYGLYKGGHILSYDRQTGRFEDHAIIPDGEGAVSMTMDTERGNIFCISWPSGNFIHYNVDTREMNDLGRTAGKGEDGTPGNDFRSLCRSLFIDQRDGTVYYSTAEGDIYAYEPQSRLLRKLEECNLRIDYFGKYDPTQPGSMGYNWRKVFWHPENAVAYGVHGNSGYLFKFDPREEKIELVERITSGLSKKSGMFDQFSYGYLGFQLGPDQETIYYLTGGPVYHNGKRISGLSEIAKGAARGLENLHLVTYHIPSGKYSDHGPVFYENGDRPLYVNSIAVSPAGAIYALARIDRNGKTITDLISIPDPLVKKDRNTHANGK